MRITLSVKRFITLNPTDGYEEGSRCRREAVSGRIELLKAFFDGDPFWMVRIRNLKDADRKYLNLYGNGHWRFLNEEDAKTKFSELTVLPKYAVEAILTLRQRERSRERMLAGRRSGKFVAVPPRAKTGKV